MPRAGVSDGHSGPLPYSPPPEKLKSWRRHFFTAGTAFVPPLPSGGGGVPVKEAGTHSPPCPQYLPNIKPQAMHQITLNLFPHKISAQPSLLLGEGIQATKKGFVGSGVEIFVAFFTPYLISPQKLSILSTGIWGRKTVFPPPAGQKKNPAPSAPHYPISVPKYVSLSPLAIPICYSPSVTEWQIAQQPPHPHQKI